MKEQYIAEFQQNEHDKGVWKNAATFYTQKIGQRYFWKLEDAEAAIQKVKELFNGKPKSTTQVCGNIGITSHTDSKTANALMVTKTRIRVRLVSEWETVTEE